MKHTITVHKLVNHLADFAHPLEPVTIAILDDKTQKLHYRSIDLSNIEFTPDGVIINTLFYDKE